MLFAALKFTDVTISCGPCECTSSVPLAIAIEFAVILVAVCVNLCRERRGSLRIWCSAHRDDHGYETEEGAKLSLFVAIDVTPKALGIPTCTVRYKYKFL